MAADKEKDVEVAVELYQESLKYFLPLLHYEPDLKRREKLRTTVTGYQRRCRELQTRDSPSTSSHSSLVALCRTSSSLLTGVSTFIIISVSLSVNLLLSLFHLNLSKNNYVVRKPICGKRIRTHITVFPLLYFYQV